MTKVRITRGDGWYAEAVGAEFEVNEENFFTDEGQVYYVDPEDSPGGRRFVRAVDCEIVSEEETELETADVIINPLVKVGDLVRINKCKECPESEGKYGTVIRTGTAAETDYDVDIPSKVYGDYTWINSDCDEWSVFPKTESESDAVSHPSHYTAGEIEVIDIIAQTVSGYNDPFLGYTLGNVIKYISRAPYKHDDPLEDLKKSREYITFAIEKLEGDSDKQ